MKGGLSVRRQPADLFDAGLVLALGGSAQYEIWVGPIFDDGIPGPPLANAVLVALITVPLAWRRRAPVAVFAIVLTAIALQVQLIDQARSDQPPLQHWLALLVVFYSLGANAQRRQALVAGAIGGSAFVATDVLGLLLGQLSAGETLPAWFLLAAAFGLGFALRERRDEATALADRADLLEREREQQIRAAGARERSQMARELHDVVAHSIGVIVVQAQAAQRVLVGEQASAREALDSIEHTGRQALDEMRRLVGILRRRDGEPALAPQPSLRDLDLLVDQVRETGLPIELRVEGERRDLAPGVDLSAYRIVQEALTNAVAHADRAPTEVVVRYLPDEVELEINDDGPGPVDGQEGGYGLIGMRERAAVYGGVLESGARDGRGYAVRARLPG